MLGIVLFQIFHVHDVSGVTGTFTKRRGYVISSPASCSGDPRFDSHSGGPHSFCAFPQSLQVDSRISVLRATTVSSHQSQSHLTIHNPCNYEGVVK
jgi:hypothetical protein